MNPGLRLRYLQITEEVFFQQFLGIIYIAASLNETSGLPLLIASLASAKINLSYSFAMYADC